MPLTYPLLREGSLVVAETALGLRIWLPWMRSLPWACISEVEVFVDEVQVGPGRMTVDTDSGLVRLEDLSRLAGYWVVGRSVVLCIADACVAESAPDVRVRVTCVIPYIFDAQGPLIVASEASVPSSRALSRSGRELERPIVD